jgi:hypothetical protein
MEVIGMPSLHFRAESCVSGMIGALLRGRTHKKRVDVGKTKGVRSQEMKPIGKESFSQISRTRQGRNNSTGD